MIFAIDPGESGACAIVHDPAGAFGSAALHSVFAWRRVHLVRFDGWQIRIATPGAERQPSHVSTVAGLADRLDDWAKCRPGALDGASRLVIEDVYVTSPKSRAAALSVARFGAALTSRLERTLSCAPEYVGAGAWRGELWGMPRGTPRAACKAFARERAPRILGGERFDLASVEHVADAIGLAAVAAGYLDVEGREQWRERHPAKPKTRSPRSTKRGGPASPDPTPASSRKRGAR